MDLKFSEIGFKMSVSPPTRRHIGWLCDGKEVRDTTVVWGHGALRLTFEWDASSAPRLAAVDAASARLISTHLVPFFEFVTASAGHRPASSQLCYTLLGQELCYVSHAEWSDGNVMHMDLVVRSDTLGIEAVAHLRSTVDVAAVQSSVTVRNISTTEHVLRSVAA